MNLDQLTQGLEQAFLTENNRIVFWYDPARDFEHDIPTFEIQEVRVLNMQGESALGIKLKLEIEDTTGKYLLYFPWAEPEIDKDWLLDIKLYSRVFYADRFSILLNELGLQQQSLREHLVEREAFLADSSRFITFKQKVQPQFNARELDFAMIATVANAEGSDLAHIIFALADAMLAENTGLEEPASPLVALAEFGLIAPLVAGVQSELGYPATAAELGGEADFNFGRFLISLLTTVFCERLSLQAGGTVPSWAQPLVLASGSARATAVALISRWCDSARFYKGFDGISAWVGEVLRIKDRLQNLELHQLTQLGVFEVVEQHIIIEIAQTIPLADATTLTNYTAIVAQRLDGHWASRHKDDPTRKKYRLIYKALGAAIDLFSMRHIYNAGFHFASVQQMYRAYECELYKFDQAYRHYAEAACRAEVDILKKLDEAVEQCYSNWFIDNLANNWGDTIAAEQTLQHWRVSDVPNQQDFFAKHIAPIFNKSKTARVAVIISDAFRYEAAVELKHRINEKRYNEAVLSSLLGVVPSYTTLGMAALLPHTTLHYRDNHTDEVLVDGLTTKSTAARDRILAAHKGMAVTADEVKKWSRDDGREAIKDKQLVYIYHNVIDARGDNAATESETFLAVEQAIEELTELTRKVLMHFNTSTVVVTADHGFLFQQGKLNDADRTALVDKPNDAFKSKKRYVLGSELPPPADALSGSTAQTAGSSSDTRFWIPKGANRFHFVGGARFVHGGIMPQEIVVPVLVVKQLRGEKAEKRTKRKVGVISPKPVLKMVNNIQRFELMQTEMISELVAPITLAVGIYDGETLVSSEEIATFECATDSTAERVKFISLSLSGNEFDRKKDYFLILRDKDLNVETERYKVTIDLAFSADFF